MKKLSATTVTDKNRRQYHIGLKPGELSENIMMVGDPARVALVAERLSNVRTKIGHREYLTITGEYKGLELSVMATGMGQDTTEIAVIESCQITKNPTFIRCGSSGALQKEIRVGDLIITRGSVRLDRTTFYYVHDGYPATAHSDVMIALGAACEKLKTPFHVGLTASAPGFYGPQGREVPGFPVRFPELPDDLARQGIANFEMETGTLLTLASLRGSRAGAVCAVFANRPRDEFANEKQRKEAEIRCIDVTLEAFRVLSAMDVDRNRRKLPFWVPSEMSR